MIYFMCISVQGSLWHKGLREAFKGTVCFGFLFNQSEINKGHWSTSGADSRDDSTFRQKCQFTEGKDRFGMFGINFKQKRLISKTTQETPTGRPKEYHNIRKNEQVLIAKKWQNTAPFMFRNEAVIYYTCQPSGEILCWESIIFYFERIILFLSKEILVCIWSNTHKFNVVVLMCSQLPLLRFSFWKSLKTE